MPSRRIIDSWLKSMAPHTYSPEELCRRLLDLGIEMEVVENRHEQLKGIVVGEVLSKEKHPNADRLSVCTVTTGGEPVTVVCGAPNVDAGQKIAFAPVGTFIADAGFTIEKRKIRGVASEGMICSEAELGIGTDHDGILVLPEDSTVGEPLAGKFGDIIYELDVTPNRGDCLSHLGTAREVVSQTGGSVFLPPPECTEAEEKAADHISVEIADPELCPRYIARAVQGVKIGPSPEWLQDTLRKLGLRPRNNVVDITSYVLFECGQPLHAFDYDRLEGKKIVVRGASGGEKFTTLDDREHELPKGALLICDAEKPVAIAGVMGGANSEIHDGTVNVLIESAYFDPTSIRSTARQLGISSDASYRFERGADIGILEYAADRAAALIAELAGGQVLAGRVDACPNPLPEQLIELRFERSNRIIGIEIPAERQMELLRSVGFGVERIDDEKAGVTVPTHRSDLFAEIDLIEEVARLNGYDAIPAESRATISFDLSTDTMLKLVQDTRAFMVDAGLTEVVSYYQTDPESAEAFGSPVELRNALGRDFSMLRTSLVPGTAKIVALNERRQRPDLRMFEIGKAFRRVDDSRGVIPGVLEVEELAVTFNGSAEPQGWDITERVSDIHDLRGMLNRYFERIAVNDISYRAVDEARWGVGAPALAIYAGEQEIGRMGPIDPQVKNRFEVDGSPIIALIDMERLAPYAYAKRTYSVPSRFPVVRRDLSLLVAAEVPNEGIERTIRSRGGDLLSDVRLFDLYRGRGVDPGKKSMTYSLAFTSYERTLEDADVDSVVDRVVKALEADHGATLRG